MKLFLIATFSISAVYAGFLTPNLIQGPSFRNTQVGSLQFEKNSFAAASFHHYKPNFDLYPDYRSTENLFGTSLLYRFSENTVFFGKFDYVDSLTNNVTQSSSFSREFNKSHFQGAVNTKIQSFHLGVKLGRESSDFKYYGEDYSNSRVLGFTLIGSYQFNKYVIGVEYDHYTFKWEEDGSLQSTFVEDRLALIIGKIESKYSYEAFIRRYAEDGTFEGGGSLSYIVSSFSFAHFLGLGRDVYRLNNSVKVDVLDSFGAGIRYVVGENYLRDFTTRQETGLFINWLPTNKVSLEATMWNKFSDLVSFSIFQKENMNFNFTMNVEL